MITGIDSVLDENNRLRPRRSFVDERFGTLAARLAGRRAAPEECRMMLALESVDWSDCVWNEDWPVPRLLLRNERIDCGTQGCGGRMLFHPRSGMLWCPNCQALLDPSDRDAGVAYGLDVPVSDDAA